jgi:hypothetical protein
VRGLLMGKGVEMASRKFLPDIVASSVIDGNEIKTVLGDVSSSPSSSSSLESKGVHSLFDRFILGSTPLVYVGVGHCKRN